MQQIICINDTFTPEQKAHIPNLPVENKIYTIRDLFNTDNGMAIHLNEIHNPRLNGGSIGTNTFSFEPSFSVERFTDLLGRPLNVEELRKEMRKSNSKVDIDIDLLKF